MPFDLGLRKVVERFVGSTLTPDGAVASFETAPRLAWCDDQVHAGTADIIMFDRPVVVEYLLNYGGGRCKHLAEVDWLSVVPDTWVFAMRAEDRQFSQYLSSAIASFKNTPEFVRLEVRHMLLRRTCEVGTAEDTDPIDIAAMSGLYLITAVLAGFAVLLALTQRIYDVYSATLPDVQDHAMKDPLPHPLSSGRSPSAATITISRGAQLDLDDPAMGTDGQLLRAILDRLDRVDQRMEMLHEAGSKPDKV